MHPVYSKGNFWSAIAIKQRMGEAKPAAMEPLRSTEAGYLRERAERLRSIAAVAPRSLTSDRLIEIADDLERRAADLEREQDIIGKRQLDGVLLTAC